MKHDVQNFLKLTIDNLENLLEFPKEKCDKIFRGCYNRK